MPATVTSISPRRTTTTGSARTPEPRRPFRDNPRLILAGMGALILVLATVVMIATGSSRFSPDFFSQFRLYALSAPALPTPPPPPFLLPPTPPHPTLYPL